MMLQWDIVPQISFERKHHHPSGLSLSLSLSPPPGESKDTG